MLTYPFDTTVPAPGELIDVAPGVRWLRMPLPMALDHINLYLLEDEDGWWIVDTGIALGQTRDIWEQVFERHLEGKPVKAVVSTHWHPDHTGMAGWLCERWRAPFYITRTEYLTGMLYTRSTPEQIRGNFEQYQLRLGREAADAASSSRSVGGINEMITPLPPAYQRLVDGQSLAINGHRWRVVVGRGHSPEHACLFSDSLNVLISGDQVIPRISSNISVSADEPDGNPLKEWLQSLEQFLDVLPEDALVLPAHNVPFHGLHPRLRALIEHHEENLLVLEEALVDEARTALDLVPTLFRRNLSEEQVNMALGECLAHLNYLLHRGQLERRLDARGRYLYRSVDDTLPLRLRQHRGPKEDWQPLQV